MKKVITTEPKHYVYTCEGCKKRVYENWKYCAYCGEELEWNLEEVTEEDETTTENA